VGSNVWDNQREKKKKKEHSANNKQTKKIEIPQTKTTNQGKRWMLRQTLTESERW
jgi:hypothetical protein